MASHEADDSIGRAFGLQRTAIREARMAVWNGLVLQRRLDDAVRTGVQAEAATRAAALEFGADTVRDAGEVFDDLLGVDGASDDRGPIGRLVDGPLDALVAANDRLDETVAAGLDGGLDRYESGLRSVLLALNRRVSALLDRHEALEARLREYVGRLDDDERAERVAEFRRQLSSLQAALHTMNARLVGYDASMG